MGGGILSAWIYNNFVGLPSGYTAAGGMIFGGPLAGMPLPPPPGMLLPGGKNVALVSEQKPTFPFPGLGAGPTPVAQGGGGRVEG